jgi:hypothetical protein
MERGMSLGGAKNSGKSMGNTMPLDASTSWFLDKKWERESDAQTAGEASLIGEGLGLTTGVIEDPNKVAADKGALVPASPDAGSTGLSIPILGDVVGLGQSLGDLNNDNAKSLASGDSIAAFFKGEANPDYWNDEGAPDGWLWQDNRLVRKVQNVELSGYSGGSQAGGRSGYY